MYDPFWSTIVIGSRTHLYSHKESFGAVWGLELFAEENGSTGIVTVGSDGTLRASNTLLHGKRALWRKHTELFRVSAVDQGTPATFSARECIDATMNFASPARGSISSSVAAHEVVSKESNNMTSGLHPDDTRDHIVTSINHEWNKLESTNHQQYSHSHQLSSAVGLPRVHIHRDKPPSTVENNAAAKELVTSATGIALHAVAVMPLSEALAVSTKTVTESIASSVTNQTNGSNSTIGSSNSNYAGAVGNTTVSEVSDRPHPYNSTSSSGNEDAAETSSSMKTELPITFGKEMVVACAGAAGLLRVAITNIFAKLYNDV